MKIILNDTVKNLGRTGDLVTVADGYARNYLIPKNLALIADEKNVKRITHQKQKLAHKLTKQLDGLREYAKKLETTLIRIARKAGEKEKLFGSVTNHDIEEALKQAGFDIDRKAIQLPEPIKALGEHRVTVKLAPEVTAQVVLQVVAENQEKPEQPL